MTTKKKNWIEGFGYLRAIMALFVVAIHSQLLGLPTKYDPLTVGSYMPSIRDVLYFDLILVAVPTFVLLSLVLYLGNTNRKQGYLRTRCKKLLFLSVVWGGIAFMQKWARGINISDSFSTPMGALGSIFSTGESIYYFFNILIITHIILEGYLLLAKKYPSLLKPLISGILFAISLIAMMGTAHLLASLYGISVRFWNPINFLPLVFGAVLLDHIFKHSKSSLKFGVFFLILWTFAAFLEWYSYSTVIWDGFHGSLLPNYTRLSVALGGMALVLIFFNIKRTPKLFALIGKHSLGIYCLHLYFPLYLLLHRTPLADSWLVGPLSFIFQAACALVASIILTKIPYLRKIIST